MVNKVRTLDFLPEIFRTKPNQEFLGATLDQLVQPPQTERIEGYIGRKFEYGIDANAVYKSEPNDTRTNYQLEPGVVFTNTNSSVAKDFITYPGLIDAIATQGGITDNHSKLFSNEFYSWDSFVDLDKLINFSQYYWLPDGPDTVDVTTEVVNSQVDFTVISGINNYGIKANAKRIPQSNPPLKLVRGGTYKFIVDQPNNFWIQTHPGTNGKDPIRTNLTTREIYGVENNGTNQGVITFTVPQATDQDEWIFPGENYVDLVSTLPISELHGKFFSMLTDKFPAGIIDSINQIRDKKVLFLNYEVGQSENLPTFYDINEFEFNTYDDVKVTYPNDNFYRINFKEYNGDFIVIVEEAGELPVSEKITAIGGRVYTHNDFVRLPTGQIAKIPAITAPLDVLYYQDESLPNKVGKLQILDSKNNNLINVEADVLNKTSYTSPLGIKFTNGLKIKFSGNIIPAHYKKGEYYVEGVGTSIKLIPVDQLNVVEPFGQLIYTMYDTEPFDSIRFGGRVNMPVQKDYITINRSAENKNAWSRSNRWFHIDVLKATAEYTGGAVSLAALNNRENRANRPILEFYPDLKLFDSGVIGKGVVDFINYSITDVMNPVTGIVNKTEFIPDPKIINNVPTGTPVEQGHRIIFAGSNDPEIRNKIFIVNFVSTVDDEPRIILTKAPDGDIQENDQIHVRVGENYGGKSFYFYNKNWNQSQQKDFVNQTPKFDIFNKYGISLSDQEYYPGTNFKGCTLFEFKPGNGANDSVLGFPIAYSSVNNIGDISFRISLNEDEFKYSTLQTGSVTEKVSIGYPHRYQTRVDYTKELGWKKAVGESYQFQTYNFVFNPKLKKNFFICGAPILDTSKSPWPVIKVQVENKVLSSNEFIVEVFETETKVTLKNLPNKECPVQILIQSEAALGKGAYYNIPVNLSSNPFNVPITSLSLGDIRGHYQSIVLNSQKITGEVFGANNYRDAGYVINYGDKIIQNSAPLVVPAALLRNKTFSLFDALTYNANEYVNFKLLITSIIETVEYNGQSAADLLDLALQQIANYKDQNTPFFWSDMIPARAPAISNSYTFNAFIETSFFTLSRIYDFTTANYFGVLIYLTREFNGTTRTVQLVKNKHYTISPDEPKVTMTLDLQPGDVITINEYNQTYGSFVPNTPTKLGLYPLYEPEVIYDDTYVFPAFFLKGHDGSLTRLYGKVTEDGFLVDFRDKVLLEFETRIYNNTKFTGSSYVTYDDVVPGYFRKTEYSFDFVNSLYTTYFLNWVGQNRVDYKNQYFLPDNPFTYNYSNASLKLDRQIIKQGNWRGLYLYLYDTTTPHKTPWEMLGFIVKPHWWDERYGDAPYTYENKILWDDLEKGYNYNDGDPYIIKSRIRSGLTKIIPSDSKGNLRNPIDFLIMPDIERQYRNNWKAGDYGPQEYSYYKSSTYPFDLIRLLAISKPAKFFSLMQDSDLYSYNSEFQQFLINDRYRLSKPSVKYGSGVAQHGYINWIVDYVQSTGVNGNAKLSEFLNNLDVRLIYRLAGFSDKDLLKFYLEKTSTGTKNSSLLIPDNSFALMLYENEPFDRISYSSVIVQKTTQGYKVYGNSQNKSYFKTYTPNLDGTYTNITVEQETVYVSTNFYPIEVIVPYGTEFLSLKELAEFIVNYGRFLMNQGMKFDSIENGIEINWEQMVAEILYWAQTGWEVGSTINVNPAANGLKIDKENAVVQPLTLHQQNFALNQNLIPILLKDLSVNRNGTEFNLKTLNSGDAISYFTANMSTIEHAIVFDNYTLFNDTIYNPITGLRQYRILMKGVKTAEWKGMVDTYGFILNQDNIKDWEANQKYIRGDIVKYKNSYWMANERIAASPTFNQEKWTLTDYEKIQKGLLPNASNRSLESELYYDTSNTNLESDANLLAFSLIGYRPRDYLLDSNLDDISQVNVYKNIIAEKGTKLVTDAVQNITLTTGKISYDVYENWALKTSEYGGLESENFIEFVLNESKLPGNPAIIGVIKNESPAGVMQEVPFNSLTNYGRTFNDKFIAPVVPKEQPDKLPSAGYVHFDDVRGWGYTLQGVSQILPPNLLNMDDYVWVAEQKGDWYVYTTIPITDKTNVATLINLVNNFDATATLTFAAPHNLTIDDLITIINFDERVNGFYEIASITGPNTLLINLTLATTVLELDGSGIVAKFQSQRVKSPKDIETLKLVNGGFSKCNVWVDNDTDGKWAVYQKSINYSLVNVDKPTSTPTLSFGSAVAQHPDLGFFITDAAQGRLFRYTYDVFPTARANVKEIINNTSGYGRAIAISGNTMIVSKPGTTSQLFVYRLQQSRTSIVTSISQPVSSGMTIVGLRVGESIALSGDENWLYATSISGTTSHIRVYKKTGNYIYTYVRDINLPFESLEDKFGLKLSTNHNGTKLFVGLPYDNFGTGPSTVVNVGAVYIFNRLTERIDVRHRNSFEYTQDHELTVNEEDEYVDEYRLVINPGTGVLNPSYYLNGRLLANNKVSRTGNKIKFNLQLRPGDIIEVSYSEFTHTQTLYAPTDDTPFRPGTSYGLGLDCNKFGNELIVGAPFYISSDNVEGAAFRYTNASRKYGTIVGQTAYNLTDPNKTILINGVRVTLDTNIDKAVEAINIARINNVYASKTANNRIIIGLEKNELAPNEEKLTIQALSKTVLEQIGIVEYTLTQKFKEPEILGGATQFGYTINFNEYNSFAIGAPATTRRTPVFFDFKDDTITINDTVFDNNFTKFVDELGAAGSVYIYDYMPNYNESLDDPGKYVYSQSANDNIRDLGYNPHYGNVIDFKHYNLLVGCPNYKPGITGGNGRVVLHRNFSKKPNWTQLRKSNDIVDINRIQNVQIYSNINNDRLQAVDYIDPLQGKLLGIVADNLDFIGAIDPAGYNSVETLPNMIWGDEHVGKLWFNTSTTKFVNYHQSNVVYNSGIWGQVFPGSTVAVYTWIESNVIPLDYSGSGTIYNYDKYTTLYVEDKSGKLIPKYYYWVTGTRTINEKLGKTLTDNIIEQYIANPQSSGISFLAPLQNNVFALYNCRDYIKSTDSSLHIGFTDKIRNDDSYSEFQLIRDGHPDDFLAGVPNPFALGEQPDDMYEKLLDSLSGIDSMGNIVPDIYLPKLLQQGIKNRPRQSLFNNRLKALENFCKYANSVLAQYPISENKTPSFIGETNQQSVSGRAQGLLSTRGEYFNTADYWQYVYWWADGYNDNTKTDVEVLKYYDLSKLNAFENMLAGVTTNSDGKREVYIYKEGNWLRIGLEQGTIQIKDSLYNYNIEGIGFGNNFFDIVTFDQFPHIETRYIIRALIEEIFTNELQVHRNKSLTLLFEYTISEATIKNQYLPWLNKTSLVDVTNTIRELKPDLNYKSDNQDFLQGYIREVKPYHVVIKEFAIKYTVNNTYDGQITDFDLPAKYDFNLDRFITPNLSFYPVKAVGEFGPTDPIWENSDYFDWLDNYGLSLTGEKNVNICAVTRYVSKIAEVIYVDNANGLPVQGVVKINNEFIAYNLVDRQKGTITGLTRGLNDTAVAEHIPGDKVYIDLFEIIVLDTGRSYSDVPTVTAYIDTNRYPTPIREAVLEPIMVEDKVVGVNVVDAGLGYVTTPEIVIQPSYTVTFDSSSVNYIENTINIKGVELVTGDVVRFVNGTGPTIKGLVGRKYYYVRLIWKDETFGFESIVALYSTKTNALLDNHRIELLDAGSSKGNLLQLAARAVAIASNTPTREVTTKLKFDRTSYVSKVTEWKPGTYYSSPFTASGAESSVIDLVASDTSLTSVQNRVFTISNFVLEEGTNNIIVTTSYAGTNIKPGQLKGLPLYFYTLPPVYLYPKYLKIQDAVEGNQYRIVSLGSTNWNIVNDTVNQTYSIGSKITIKNSGVGTGIVTAFIPVEDVVQNKTYVIVQLGDTDWYELQHGAGSSLNIQNAEKGQKVKIVFLGTTNWNTVAGTTGVTYSVGNEITIQAEKDPVTGLLNVSGNGKVKPVYNIGDEVFVNHPLEGTGTGIVMQKGHALFKVYKPKFEFNKVYEQYFIEILNRGNIYDVNDKIIIDGRFVGGVTGVNDVFVKVIYAPDDAIELYELSGKSAGGFKQFYVDPISDTELRIYYDAPMVRPVIGFVPWDGKESYKRGLIVAAENKYYRAIKDISPKIINARTIKQGESYYIYKLGSTDWSVFGVTDSNVLNGNEPFTATTRGTVLNDLSSLVYDNNFTDEGWELLSENPFPFNPYDYIEPYDDLGYLDELSIVPSYSFYMYLPEPVVITSGYSRNIASIVSLNNRLYRCIESNNDTEFNFNKWVEIDSNQEELNALDRIVGFYQPTVNMPGKNFPLLLTGVDYPNNTYYSNKFDENYTLDTELKDVPFYPKDIKIRSVLFDNEKYIAVADGKDYSMVLLSDDEGLTWRIKRISSDVLNTSDIIFSGTHYVITTRKAKSPVYISYDGLNWIGIGAFTPYDTTDYDEPGEAWDSSSLSAPTGGLYNVASNGNLYVAAGDKIIASTDAYSWKGVFDFSSQTVARANYIDYVDSNAFRGFIAVGYGEDVVVDQSGLVASQTTSVGRVVKSVDGLNWETVWPHPTNNGLNTVVGGPDVIVFAGDNGTVLYSVNAQNFFTATLSEPIIEHITAGCYAQNTFVLVGTFGLILISYDGINWSKVNSNTAQNLNGVTFDGQHFLAVGNDATILRSWEGIEWVNISTISGSNTFYEIKGDPFTAGYGPEEMVPGAISDQLSITVTTKPGTSWPVSIYQHNGFAIKSKVVLPINKEVTFGDLSQTPAQLAVFVVNTLSNLSIMIYPNVTVNEKNTYTYSVDWINKKIVLNRNLEENYQLLVEVYEFGNGNQVERATSETIPITLDPVSGFTQIELDTVYEEIAFAPPAVYVNGIKKFNNIDFSVASTESGRAKLLFNGVYNLQTQFISFAMFGSSAQNYEYSLPETQVFNFDETGQTGLALDYELIENESDEIISIVRINGKVIAPDKYDLETTGSPTLSITDTLEEGDIISITTFNDPRGQYLRTDVVDNLKVVPLLSVNITTDIVYLYITVEPDADPYFITGDRIQIDGIIGTNQLNNNTYYIKLEQKFTESFPQEDGSEITLDVYPITLYFNPELTRVVTSKQLTEYIRSGFIWKYNTTYQINQPVEINLTDTSRLYVSVNGVRVAPNNLRLNDDNLLSIMTKIETGDEVIITSMTPTASPNKMTYINEIDKNGDQKIYRANPINKTWLTKNLEPLEDIIYVKDIIKVIDIVQDTYTVNKERIMQPETSTYIDQFSVRIKYDLENIKETIIFNETSLTPLKTSDFYLVIRNATAFIYFRNGVSEGDEISVTMRLGDIIDINGEKIRYKKVNFTDNTISGLTRGILGSAIADMHLVNSSVVGITPTNTLPSFYYNRTWNSENFNTLKGDPLQLSDSIPSRFLQQDTK